MNEFIKPKKENPFDSMAQQHHTNEVVNLSDIVSVFKGYELFGNRLSDTDNGTPAIYFKAVGGDEVVWIFMNIEDRDEEFERVMNYNNVHNEVKQLADYIHRVSASGIAPEEIYFRRFFHKMEEAGLINNSTLEQSNQERA